MGHQYGTEDLGMKGLNLLLSTRVFHKAIELLVSLGIWQGSDSSS